MVEGFIAAIKEKKEFHALSNDFVQEKVDEFFKRNPKNKVALEQNSFNKKSAIFKQSVKEIRANLRDVYGLFQTTSMEKRRQLFEEYKGARGRGAKRKVLNDLFASHQSTKERREHFAEFYKEIFTITGYPEYILDIGCGYNPLSYDWIKSRPYYEASDIAEEDINLLNDFFEHEDIDGEAYTLDLLNDAKRQEVFKETEADMVFILKLIDTLEGQRRNISKSIVTELFDNKHVRWVVATFPLKSVGGRVMRQGGKENWFSRFLDKNNFAWSRVEVASEDCYIISKGDTNES